MKFFQVLLLLAYLETVKPEDDSFFNDSIDAEVNHSSLLLSKLQGMISDHAEYHNFMDVVQKIIESSQPKLLSIISVMYPPVYDDQGTFDMVNELLRKLPLNVKYRLQDFEHIEQRTMNFRPRYYNVIFLNNYEEFAETVLHHFEKRSFDYSGYYIVILTNREKFEQSVIKKIMTDFWNFRIVNIIVLIRETNGTILSLTYFPFGPNYCEEVRPIITMTYENRNYSTMTFFPWKLRNFYGCPLTVAIVETPPFVSYVNNSFIVGMEGYVLYSLSKILNFTPNIIMADKYERQGTIYPNGTVTGGLGLLFNKKANLSLGFFDIREDRIKLFDHSSTLFSARMQFLATVKAHMSPIEWLGVAFQKTVWFAITLTLLIGFIVISLLKKRPKHHRDFVIGEEIKNPTLNMMVILLGNPLNRLPGRNFARTMIIYFMLFTLVLRTVYQGALFEVAQHDRAYVTSLREMIHQNFTIYSAYPFKPYINAVPNLNNNVIYLIPNQDQYMRKVNKSQLPGAKLSILSTEYHIFYMNHKYKCSPLLRPTKPELTVLNIAIFLPKQSLLTRVISVFVSLLSANGLVQKGINEYYDKDYLSVISDMAEEIEQVTLDDVSGIFQLLMGGLVVATFVFFAEIIYHKVSLK